MVMHDETVTGMLCELKLPELNTNETEYCFTFCDENTEHCGEIADEDLEDCMACIKSGSGEPIETTLTVGNTISCEC
jgi:hypothetical protein